MVAIASTYAARAFSNATARVVIAGSNAAVSASAAANSSTGKNDILDAVNAVGRAGPDVLARRIQSLLDSFGIAAPSSDASPPDSAKADDPAGQNKVPDAVKTLEQARKDVLAYRKKDALNKVERAIKELELLRRLGTDEKSIASKAKKLAEQVGKAAIEYGDAVRDLRRGAESTPPDQPADAFAPDVGGTSNDSDIKPKTAATDDRGIDAPKDHSSASVTQAATPSDESSAPSEISDPDAVKIFAVAKAELKKVFEELVAKGKIQHPSSREWREAERARAQASDAIQYLSDQVEATQDSSAASGSTVSVTAVEVQTSVSISVDIVV